MDCYDMSRTNLHNKLYLQIWVWRGSGFWKDLTCVLVFKILDIIRVNVGILVNLTRVTKQIFSNRCKVGFDIWEIMYRIQKSLAIHSTKCAKASEMDKIRFYGHIYFTSIFKAVCYRPNAKNNFLDSIWLGNVIKGLELTCADSWLDLCRGH